MHIPWTDRQVPATDEIFLDHVGWMLPDIDIAAKAFERMGFPLTPLATVLQSCCLAIWNS